MISDATINLEPVVIELDLGPPSKRPLWVRSGHMRRNKRCPLYTRKRRCAVQTRMSALGQKRTFCTAVEALLFDHFVGGGEQFGWNVEAECRGSIEVDYKFKLGRQHDR